MKYQGLHEIYSYDKDFEAFEENELPRCKQRGIECHSVLDTESSPFSCPPEADGFRRNDDNRGKPRGMNPERFKGKSLKFP